MKKKVQNNIVELPDTLWLLNKYSDYANPKAKIEKLVKGKQIIRLKKGFYINANASNDPFILGKAANRLYGPSYVSFVYVLRWYGLIPEHVPNITSATYGKNRTKRFDTPVCSFFYRDVPKEVYPFSLTFLGDSGKRFLAATPEKALCDELSTIPGVRSKALVEKLLFEDLRMDESAFFKLDFRHIHEFAGKYKRETIETFLSYTKQEYL